MFVGQELIPTTLNPVGIPSSGPTSTNINRRLDELVNMLEPLNLVSARMESIEEVEKIAMLTKRMMETPLQERPILRNAVDEHGTPRCLGS